MNLSQKLLIVLLILPLFSWGQGTKVYRNRDVIDVCYGEDGWVTYRVRLNRRFRNYGGSSRCRNSLEGMKVNYAGGVYPFEAEKIERVKLFENSIFKIYDPRLVDVSFRFKEGWYHQSPVRLQPRIKRYTRCLLVRKRSNRENWGSEILIKRFKRNYSHDLDIPEDLARYVSGDMTRNNYVFKFAPDSSNSVPGEVNPNVPTKLRWIRGTDTTEYDIPNIDTFELPYRVTGLGKITLKYGLYSECHGYWEYKNEEVERVPSCYQDKPEETFTSILGAEYKEAENGWRLDDNGTYDWSIVGATDFEDHYTLSFSKYESDPGDDVSFSGALVNLQESGIRGKYYVNINRKENRERCPEIEATEVYVNGKDTTVTSACPIVLPRDITDEISEDKTKLDVFKHHFISGQNVIVNKGLTLEKGAILTKEVIRDDAPELQTNQNYVLSKSFDDAGYMTGSSVVYLDNAGNTVQNQNINLDEATVMAFEVKDDEYGRPVLQTLTAPAYEVGGIDASCAAILAETGKVPYVYKEGFIQTKEGEDYNFTHFTGSKLGKPDSLDKTTANTLGWYYSNNNTSEKYVANTEYPFSQQEFYDENDLSESRTQVGPGDVYRDAGGHQYTPTSKTDSLDLSTITTEDYVELQNYLDLRAEVHTGTSFTPVYFQDKLAKTTVTDAKGENQVVSVVDKEGNSRYSYLKTNGSITYRAYSYYDLRGRNVVSISPNGITQYQSGTAYADIDKVSNTYDYRGRLALTTSIDKGTNSFMYRDDDAIRYSQNARQAIEGTYSFTNYDKTDRPVASGEFDPQSTGLDFGSAALIATLENETITGGIGTTGGEKIDEIRTHYDYPDMNRPSGFEQEFVVGAVSWTEKVGVSKTWYSYDERGRVTRTAHYLSGLDSTHIVSYDYNDIGDIQQVMYKPDVTGEEFYHGYEYDNSGRLKKVVTDRDTINFDVTGRYLTSGDIQCSYDYYLHGPLKRKVYGDSLQGEDYLYTVEGWLKAINTFDPATDPGKDGDLTHHPTAADQFGFSLEYYDGDYEKEGVESLHDVYGTEEGKAESDYNGNVAAQAFHNKEGTNAYTYEYDEQDRLKSATWNDITKNPDDTYSLTPSDANKLEDVTYDENGNTKGFLRRDETGGVLHDFRNKFQYDGQTNQLTSIDGYASYTYDALGQIASVDYSPAQEAAGKKDQYFSFNVTGMITGIYEDAAHTDTVVAYEYDENGFRIVQRAFNETNQAVETWYTRDANGQLMAIYQKETDGSVVQSEIPIYADGRVAMYDVINDQYAYELKDHLGSVRNVVISGKKVLKEYDFSDDSDLDAFNPTLDPFNRFVSKEVKEGHYELTLKENITEGLVGSFDLGPTEVGKTYAIDFDFDYLGSNNYGYSNDNVVVYRTVEAEAVILTPEGLETFPLQVGKNTITFTGAGNNVHIFISNPVSQYIGLLDDGDPNGAFPSYPEIEQTMIFDNLRMREVGGEIAKTVYAVDYYPMGYQLRKFSDGHDHRYGFQGEYAEDETESIGYNTFQLRFYDPVIGRWLSTDPKNVGFSPYAGMGNQYSFSMDPDGGEPITLLASIAIGAAISATTYTVGVLNTPMGWNNFEADQFAKNVLIGGASAAATFGIGQAFGHGIGGALHTYSSASNAAGGVAITVERTRMFASVFLNEVGRAAAHGLTGAAFGALSGQDFLTSFATGAAGSLVGSGTTMAGWSRPAQFLTSASFSGVVSELGGGSFLQGFARSAAITLLNHWGGRTPDRRSGKCATGDCEGFENFKIKGVQLFNSNSDRAVSADPNEPKTNSTEMIDVNGFPTPGPENRMFEEVGDYFYEEGVRMREITYEKVYIDKTSSHFRNHYDSIVGQKIGRDTTFLYYNGGKAIGVKNSTNINPMYFKNPK